MRRTPFFDGISQVELTAAGHELRLPIFYYDGRAVSAIFPARLAALRKLLPDRRFVPARLAPGVGVVAITAFEYADTDIGPYNELAVSVVLHDPPYVPNLPGLALARAMRRRQLHAYVHHLPVTTQIAWVGGRAFYNYPKFVGDIEFGRDGDQITCRLAEGAQPILTLRAAAIDAPDDLEIQFFSRLWMDRQPQSAEFKLHASRFGERMGPGLAAVELVEAHPIGRELAGVLLSRRALHLQRLERFEGILYGPEHLSLPLLTRVAHETVGDELAGAGA